MQRRILITIMCVLVGSTLAIPFIARWWWQQPISIDECRVLISRGNEISHAIDRYKQNTGWLPDKLTNLVPKHVTDVSAPRTEWFDRHEWVYVRKENGEYLLLQTALQFVSSFDALVYSSTGTIPDEWRAKAKTYEYDGWYYFVGAQNLHGLLNSVP